MSQVLSEITRLSARDCCFIEERHKTDFTYPLHKHSEFELNFIQDAAGVKRIVGDSVETIGELELVLIGGRNLEHAWEQGSCTSKDIREITIQFAPDLLGDGLLERNQFDSIRKMLDKAQNGISFPMNSILKVYNRIDNLSNFTGFEQFLTVLSILQTLSVHEYRTLSSSSFAHADHDVESRRVTKVKDYIAANYAKDITLPELAGIAGMSPSSFSRFFKMRTGKTLSNYVIDIRLGHAARELVDSTKNISEICYSCGFNNLSNFNRTFKAKRGSTPKEFRQLYKKNNVIL